MSKCKFSTLSSILFLLLLSNWNLQAQNTQEIQVNFRALSWGKPIRDVFFVQDGALVLIRMTNRAVSSTYAYSGESPLRFFRNELSEDGQRIPVEVAKVDFAPGNYNPLLVFLPESESTFRIASITDQQLYQSGSCFLYNVSGQDLAFKIGEEQLLMEPQKFQRVDLHEIAESESIKDSVSVAIASKDDQEAWDVVYRQRWPILENSSFLVFAVSQQGHIRVRLIPIPIG